MSNRFNNKVWAVPIMTAGLALGVPTAYAQMDDAGEPGAQPQPRATDQTTQPGQAQQPRAVQPGQTREQPESAWQLTRERVPGGPAEMQAAPPVRAESLIGQNIVDAQDEKLGSVYDIVIDPRQGEIKYAVVSRGGVLGVGATLYAVPIQALTYDAANDRLLMEATEADFERAQGFGTNTDEWPAQADQQVFQVPQRQGMGADAGMQQQHGHMAATDAARQQHGATATGQQQPQQPGEMGQPGLRDQRAQQPADADPMAQQHAGTFDRENFWIHRVSELTGTTINDQTGSGLATLEDIVIQPDKGKVLLGVARYDTPLGLGIAGGNFALIPWEAVNVDVENNNLIVNATRETLDRTAFQEQDLPQLTQERIEATYAAFGLQPDMQVFGFAEPGMENGMQQPMIQDQQEDIADQPMGQ
jgi:sporulation protein YlmC with PRC-barrel domain